MEKAKCFNCQNMNAVKVSSGHSKPENKGRKYFTCANCEKFNWVENGEGVSTSGLKVDYSKMPERKEPTYVQQPSYAPPTDEQMMKESFEETENEGPNWDEIRRQQFRFKGAMELIRNHGLVELTSEQKEGINKLVEFAMTGK